MIRQKKFADAEVKLIRAIDLAPDQVESLLNMAVVCRALKRLDQAVEFIKKAFIHQRDIPAAHLLLGNCYQDLDRVEAAAEEFREAVRLNPDFFEAQFNLGLAETRLGNPSGALPALFTARNLRPDDLAVVRQIGFALIAEGNLKEGLEELKTGAGVIEFVSTGDPALRLIH